MTDENLPAALTNYRRALSALLDPTPDHPDGRYTALMDALPGRQGSGGHHARSMPPLYLDAAQLLATIDVQTRRWYHHTKNGRKSLTEPHRRLQSLSEADRWRPQDAPVVNDHANTITRWTQDIDQLTLTHQLHRWELAAPCPACNTTTTHHQDTAGATVRQAALQINATGCICTHCRTQWAPEYFIHLARVIGCNQLGILE